MFADFPVLYVDGIVRRTLGSCVLLAAVALVVTFLLGQYLVGAGVVLGLAGATANHRLFQVTTVRYSDAEGHLQRKPYAGSVVARLGTLTVIAFALLFFVRPMGFGMIGGLVAFQVLLMINAVAALWHFQKAQLTGLGPGKAGKAGVVDVESYPSPTGPSLSEPGGLGAGPGPAGHGSGDAGA